jgi:translation initiation factor 2 subunit 1
MLNFYCFPVITTSAPEKEDGLKALKSAIEMIETTIKSLDGHFAIQMAVRTFKSFYCFLCLPRAILFQPKVVTAIDEADLLRRIEDAEKNNAEVSGDEDSEEDEEGMKFDIEGQGNDKESQSGSDEE